MSEPLTDEQIKEALSFADMSDVHGWLSLHVNALATTIAAGRTKAHNDALERAAAHFEDMGASREMFCDSIGDELRAMKEPK